MRRAPFRLAAPVVLALLAIPTYASGSAAVLASGSVPANTCPRPAYGARFYAPPVRGARKTVALTFDDGPGPSTMDIVHILEKARVRATFFNIGDEEAERPSDVVAEEEAGLLVADHTWSHPDLTGLSRAAQESQIERVAAEQRALVGTDPCVLRPPYGDYDATTLDIAKRLNMAVWMWSVDTEDWKADGSGSSYWVRRIIHLAESEGGALTHPIVLMHNQAIPMPATVAALPVIINFFKRRGYVFVDALGRAGPPEGCGSGPPPHPGAALLAGGRELAPGAALPTPGGQYRLVMQRDGNLVVYTGHEVVWQSATNGHKGAHAVMKRDGEFAVVTPGGREVFSTGTTGRTGAYLALQRDGNVVVRTRHSVWWSSRSWNSSLPPGGTLRSGWYLLSPGSSCRLTMSPAGDLVLTSSRGAPLWRSGGASHGDEAVLQRDGTLVVEDARGRTVWSSASRYDAGARLYVSRDGTAFLESRDGVVHWFR